MGKYFFCYDEHLHKYLHKVNNIPFICAAKHPKTLKNFWLYETNKELDQLIKQYKEFMNQSN